MLLSTAVEHQNQTLIATLRLPGAGITLAYRSDTGLGRRAAFQVHLPPRSPADPAVRAATVSVAGGVHQIDATASSWFWDGRDPTGDPVSGLQRVSIDLVTDEGIEHHEVGAGRWRAQTLGLGGWTVAGCDTLDPVSLTIFRGDGSHDGGVKALSRDGVLLVEGPGGDSQVFDGMGRLLRTIDGWTGTASVTCRYDPRGRLADLTNRDGGRLSIARDDGQPASVSLCGPHGDRLALELDPLGSLVAVTTPTGARTELQWSGEGLLSGITDASGAERRYTYDADGRLEQVDEGRLGAFALARTQTAHGWTVARLGAEGRERRHTVERLPDGTVRRESHCCGRSGSTVVERHGSASRTTLPDGTVSVATDDGGRSVTRPSGSTTTLEMASGQTEDGLPTVTQSLAGARYTETFDPATRTFISTSPAGRTNEIVLDDAGRPVFHRDAGGRAESLGYDGRGRLVARSDGTSSMAVSYDDDGRVATISDALDRTTWFEHDADGRVVRQHLPDGRSIGVEFGPAGDVVAVSPPGRPATRASFPTGGQREADHYPEIDGSTDPVSYGYDREGALIEIVRADGRRIGRELGPGGALEALVTAEGTTRYRRDPATGQLMEASTDEGSLRYEWDGPLATAVEATGPAAGRIDFHLDDALRVRSWSLAGTPAVDVEHDADGLVTAVGGLTIELDETSGAVRARRLGIVTEHREVDADGRITSLHVEVAGRTVYTARRDYGPLGRLASVVEAVNGRERTSEFRYDDADRIAEVTVNGRAFDRFVYDDNGNRTGRIGERGTWTASYDARDRINAAGDERFEHTPDGELRCRSGERGTITYVHDSLSDLVEVTLADGRRLRHHYDAHRRRVATSVDGALTRRLLYGDQLRVVAELGDDGEVTARFLRAAGALTPDVIERDGRCYLVVTDHVGSPRLLIDEATGEIAQELEHDVLGAAIVDTNAGAHPFGFAGGIVDAATGLVRFGLRDYDPTTGRWLTRDPLSFRGGMTNLYGYAAHDPVNHVDPTGSQVELCRAKADMGKLVDTIWPGAEHWWLKTADVAAGMGQHPVKGGTETALTDHSNRQGDCEEVRHVDEECVNQQLQLDNVHQRTTASGTSEVRYGRDLGPYRPWNSCQSVIDDILTTCQTRTPSSMEQVEGSLRRTILGEGSILPQFDTATPKGYELTGEPAARPVPHVEHQDTPVDPQQYTPVPDYTPVEGYGNGEGGELWD